MNGEFSVNSNLFLQAKRNIDDAVIDCTKSKIVLNEVLNNFPIGFEYAADISHICNSVNKVSSYLKGFQNIVDSTKTKLENLNTLNNNQTLINTLSNNININIDELFAMFNTYGINQETFEGMVSLKKTNNDWMQGRDKENFLGYLKIKYHREKTEEEILDYYNEILDNVDNYEMNLDVLQYLYDCHESSEERYKIFSENFEAKINDEFLNIATKYESYGLTECDIVYLLSFINNNAGICTYAATANKIISYYMDKQEEFENVFGFKMYNEVNGKKILNSKELLLDMYVFANDKANYENAKLFDSSDGNLKIVSGNFKFQNYIQVEFGTSYIVQDYLDYHNANLKYVNKLDYFDNEIKSNNYFNSSNLNDTDIIARIKNLQDKNCEISINFISSNNDWNWKNSESQNYVFNENHSVYVTGVTDDSVIVSSWGERYTIPGKEFISKNFYLDISYFENK